MAKLVLFLALAASCLLAEGSLSRRLFKRQTPSCEVTDLPEQCRPIFNYTVDGAAYFDPSNFLATYCSEACAQPLYNHFRDCDPPESANATKFDFFCSENEDDEACLPGVVPLLTDFNNSVIYICATGLGFDGSRVTCSDDCRTALESASADLGCCLFSFSAVLSGGTSDASIVNRYCSEDDNPPTPELCDGGVTGEKLRFPAEMADVDPVCEDLVEEVDGSCRGLLSKDVTDQIYTHWEQLCGDECGPEVYRFSRDCDERTGTSNATALDTFCAENAAGQRCAQVVLSFVSFAAQLESCTNFDSACSDECREGLMEAQSQAGCCLTSLYLYFSDNIYIDLLFSRCGIERLESCDGRFTGRPVQPPPTDIGRPECEGLRQDLPDSCHRYASLDTLTVTAYLSPADLNDFCSGDCASDIYDYYLKCDSITYSDDAPSVDFLCAESDGEEDSLCGGIYADRALITVFNNSCSDTSDTFCSQECATSLQEPSKEWGCCLFTLAALGDNVTFVEGIVEQCRLDFDGGVCIGGLSGKPVAAPGQPVEPNAKCYELRKAIPEECREAVSFEALMYAQYMYPDSFLKNFCESSCAETVYNYVAECGDERSAAYVDFLCSESGAGTDCGKVVTDQKLGEVISGVCDSLTDVNCPADCREALQGLSQEWGCCLYSYSTIQWNVTYSNDVYNECMTRNPGLCIGGVTKEPINAPGSEEIEDDAAVTTMISSSVLLIAAALASL
jgi:hypothetical protein